MTLTELLCPRCESTVLCSSGYIIDDAPCWTQVVACWTCTRDLTHKVVVQVLNGGHVRAYDLTEGAELARKELAPC